MKISQINWKVSETTRFVSFQKEVHMYLYIKMEDVAIYIRKYLKLNEKCQRLNIKCYSKKIYI